MKKVEAKVEAEFKVNDGVKRHGSKMPQFITQVRTLREKGVDEFYYLLSNCDKWLSEEVLTRTNSGEIK